jgi:cobalt/nickel transport protein
MKRGSGMKLELMTLSVIILFIAAIAYVSSSGNHDWRGADGQAQGVIANLTGGTYIPWFGSIYQPPSGEIEGLLFALPAAIGSLIIGYFLGYYRALAKIEADKSVPEQEGNSDA